MGPTTLSTSSVLLCFLSMMLAASLLPSIFLAFSVFAHPFHVLSDAEVAARDDFQYNARRSLAGCQSNLQKRDGAAQRSVDRRMEFLNRIRADRIVARSK